MTSNYACASSTPLPPPPGTAVLVDAHYMGLMREIGELVGFIADLKGTVLDLKDNVRDLRKKVRLQGEQIAALEALEATSSAE